MGDAARRSTLELVLDTGVLVAAVVAAAIVIGVPLAWLVVRTDLPGRRVWAAAAALPLVIPSYVAALALLGAFGPRGLLQRLLEGPFGVERLPGDLRLPGRVPGSDALHLPVRVPADRGRAARTRSGPRGGGTQPRTRPARRLPGSHSAVAAALDRRRRPAGRALHAVRLRRGLADAVRRAHARDLSPVPVALRPDTGGDAVARARRADRRGARDRGADAAAGALLPHRLRAAARHARRVALGRWRWPALAFCGAVVGLFLAVPVAVLVYWSARAVELGRCSTSPGRLPSTRCSRPGSLPPSRWSRLCPSRYSGSATGAVDAPARASVVLGERAARHRDRALARLLRRALRRPALPDARAARVRVRRPLPPAGAGRYGLGAADGQPAAGGGGARARPLAARGRRARDRAARALRASSPAARSSS